MVISNTIHFFNLCVNKQEESILIGGPEYFYLHLLLRYAYHMYLRVITEYVHCFTMLIAIQI